MKKKLVYREGFWASLFLAPNLIGFLIFVFMPIVASFGLSFTSWDLLTEVEWVGLGNYAALLMEDEIFWRVLWNTIYFSIGTVPVSMIIALFLAMALDRKIIGMKLYRAAYFVPFISSTVAVAVVWQWLYNPSFGLLNYLLGLVGLSGPSWLSSTTWAMPAVIIMSIWRGLGFPMLLYLAGLQGIPDSYYEVAEIDGAGWFTKFRHVTIPLLSTTTFFVLIMSIIGSFQVFDQIYIMTGGGPARSTSVLVHYMYQNAFNYFRMGYANAIAYVMFFLVFLFTMVQFRRSKNWVVY